MTDERRIRSADGTELAVAVTGQGPPIVLVHGSAGTKDAWAFVAPALATEYTVWSYDRRGRGESGDAASYELDLEIEDVLAVVNAAGASEPVVLVGHSFGACCALEAAARKPDAMRALVLYEPPFHVTRAEAAIARANDLLLCGQADEAVETFLTGVAAVSAEEIALLRAFAPTWTMAVEAAHTVSREIAALVERSWNPERYGNVRMPTLLIWGALTDSQVYLALDELRAAVPHADGVSLEQQRHLAIGTRPDVFAHAVLRHARRAASQSSTE